MNVSYRFVQTQDGYEIRSRDMKTLYGEVEFYERGLLGPRIWRYRLAKAGGFSATVSQDFTTRKLAANALVLASQGLAVTRR